MSLRYGKGRRLFEPGFAIWFTGLPASGKSTLARAVQRALAIRGVHAVVLDSDELRAVLTPQPTYEDDERDWFYSVIVHLTDWLTRSGVNVLIAATANRSIYRDQARTRIPRFAEVYVLCPPELLRHRDPKGLYLLAATGEAPHLPSAGAIYEAPLNPEVVIDTERLSPDEAAAETLLRLGLAAED